MVPIRREIDAGIRRLKVDAPGERVGTLEAGMAEARPTLAGIEELQ